MHIDNTRQFNFKSSNLKMKLKVEHIKLSLIFMCCGAIANTAIPETRDVEKPSEARKLFIEEIHMLENRHEEKLKYLRNEMMQTNKRLQKSVDELSNKLDEERRRNCDAIKQLRNDFIEKETKLTLEINALKDQLMKERNVRNHEVGHLNAMVSESMAERKMDFKIKEEAEIVPKGRKRQTAVYGSTQVAFSARLTTDTPSLSPNQDIVFNDVIVNVGSAYHNAHGIFVAPVPGVYLFTTSLLAYGTKSHHAKIVRGGQELAKTDFNDADSFDDSSQSVIVQLQKGDFVAVQNADYSGMVYTGFNYSTFSGFLLYEYEDMSQPVGK